MVGVALRVSARCARVQAAISGGVEVLWVGEVVVVPVAVDVAATSSYCVVLTY